jgi:transcriptional regulator with XRE-family HTH domain
MNVPQILKTIRMRDKQIADAMGVKVAQISRRQKEIQQPSDDKKVKLREFIEKHILTLQQYLDGERTTTAEPIEQPTQEAETTPDTDTQENTEEAESEPEEEIKPTRKPRYNE